MSPGTRVSRYVVRAKLGAGAMGVVYAADDPELGRRVALKMLRPEGNHKAKLQQRLLREAQALARLSHPNVVTLFDVGMHDDGIFLAMELIDGVTLKEWMQRRHPWEEVLQVFLDAGKGLEAAHSAGLVHRDFKPANVLMGNDGRVFVTDFGIARSLDQNSEEDFEKPSSLEIKLQPSDPLTQTGQILGTPAYLAPELVHGQRGDARSDEFSYCVALHEALFGERPFRGNTLHELAEAARRGKVTSPQEGGTVPPHVLRALRQGLSGRPEDRFPTMRALLAALAPLPRRKHERIFGAVLLTGVLGAVATYGVVEYQRKATCAVEVEKSLVAWGPVQREQMHEAFLATGVFYASQAWSDLAITLDAYTAQWRALRTESCMAAKGEDAHQAQQTSACLDARLWQFAAITNVLQKADTPTVQNARQIAASLEGLSGCRDAQGFSSRPQPPDGLRPQVDAVRSKLVQVRTHHLANRLTEALALSTTLIEEQQGIGYKPLEAEVFLSHGMLLSSLGNTKEAEKFIYPALWAAEAAHDDETAARAWLEVVTLEAGAPRARPDEVEKLIQHARAAVARLGRERFPDITTDLHISLATIRRMHGQLFEAEREALEGLDFARERLAADNLRIPHLIHELGQIDSIQGNNKAALQSHRQALELREKILGPNNSALATSYNQIAHVSFMLGLRAEAVQASNKALAHLEASSSQGMSVMATTLVNLARIARIEGRAEEAQHQLDRASQLLERMRAPDHISVVHVLTEQALLAQEQGHDEQALRLASDAVKRIETDLGPDTEEVVLPLTIRGKIHLRARRHPEARRDLQAALKREEKIWGPEGKHMGTVLLSLSELALATQSPKEALASCVRVQMFVLRTQGDRTLAAANALSCRGEAHLAMGTASDAIQVLERAWGIHQNLGAPQDPKVVGKTAFLLARAYLEVKTSPDRAKALAMAEESRSLFASVSSRAQTELKEVEAWQKREARP
ncbi:protein kinase domain-containing protein [Myxococcus landrumensis]|uniref:serine/threonine-protein kinase n=1 Tax=Myxococcus landrumensis TaxID=2813577 RepID=UPI001F5090A7|nr:serine/threonine-protein kinase [Myxococcus landrumus]